MIITVTMNPAIDKTVEISTLVQGGLNRIRKSISDAGGKGINVSKTIRELGGESLATGFLGGSAGRTIKELLDERGIENEFVSVDGMTRTNTKVLEDDGTLTELNEAGPEISEDELQKLLDIISIHSGAGVLVVLSGSVPSGVPKDIYAKIIRLAHQKGASVLLDADGELFAEAVKAGPDIIKPNRFELEQYFGRKMEDVGEVKKAFASMGIRNIVISMGGEGAVFCLEDYEAKSEAIPVKLHSAVGAGDAMVAALAYAWEKNLSKEETAILCVAASAGAVMTEGTKPPEAELVDMLKKEARLAKLS